CSRKGSARRSSSGWVAPTSSTACLRTSRNSSSPSSGSRERATSDLSSVSAAEERPRAAGATRAASGGPAARGGGGRLRGGAIAGRLAVADGVRLGVAAAPAVLDRLDQLLLGLGDVRRPVGREVLAERLDVAGLVLPREELELVEHPVRQRL